MRHVDDERARRPSVRPGPIQVSSAACDCVQMNGASRVRERVDHLDLRRALDDLKRIGHVGRARNARECSTSAQDRGRSNAPRCQLCAGCGVWQSARRPDHAERSSGFQRQRRARAPALRAPRRMHTIDALCVTAPGRASCACRSQLASLIACQTPLKFACRSAVRAGRELCPGEPCHRHTDDGVARRRWLMAAHERACRH